jgi:hypothetical protein
VDVGSFHARSFGVVFVEMLVSKEEFETSGYEYSAGMLAMLFDVTVCFGNLEAEASYSLWSQILVHFSSPSALNITILQLSVLHLSDIQCLIISVEATVM